MRTLKQICYNSEGRIQKTGSVESLTEIFEQKMNKMIDFLRVKKLERPEHARDIEKIIVQLALKLKEYPIERKKNFALYHKIDKVYEIYVLYEAKPETLEIIKRDFVHNRFSERKYTFVW